MALTRKFVIGGRLYSADEIQHEINTLEAGMVDKNSTLNQFVNANNNLKQQRDVANTALRAIAKQLGFEHFDNEQVAIEIEKLQEESAIAHQLQSDLINTDFGELRSERDYYRGILDKLCDRLNVKDIEELEHVAKYQEMGLDFASQHNEELLEQLANSQAMELKHTGRIFDLERRVRSLLKPVEEIHLEVNSDRLSDIETTKLIRVLLNLIP